MPEANSANASPGLLVNASKPLVLAGPPGDMTGLLAVHNRGDRYRMVAQPTLRVSTGVFEVAKDEGKAAEPDATTVGLRSIIVPPRSRRHVPISLALDPTTPPGVYEAVLEVEGETRQVILHVAEDLSFTLSPGALIIPNQPGDKFDRTVTIENQGNVPVVIPSLGTVALDDELAQCRALRGALGELTDATQSFDDFLLDLAKRVRKQVEFQFLEVKNPKTTVGPGGTAHIALTVTVSKKLHPHARFTGYAPVGDQNLTFTVVPH